MKVHGVLSDPKTETQIVILRDDKNSEILPIWVGQAEGNAIRLALEGVLPPRPMTHDLIKGMLEHLGIQLQKVVVNEIKDNTYYATIHLVAKEVPGTVDARPSDAIALALRTGVPVFATEEVLKKKSAENLDTWLQQFHSKDIGKYDA
jgi:bifunctional DNase/RNase